MFERAGSRFGTGGVESGAAAAGNDDAVGAGDLGRADDGPQVVRVGDAVAQHDKGALAPALGQRQNIAQRGVAGGGCHGDNALVRAGGAHAVQLAAVTFLCRNPLFAGAVNDAPQGRRRTGREKKLVQLPAGAQRFPYGVFALQQILARRRFALVPLFGGENRRTAAAPGRAGAVLFILFHLITPLRSVSRIQIPFGPPRRARRPGFIQYITFPAGMEYKTARRGAVFRLCRRIVTEKCLLYSGCSRIYHKGVGKMQRL